MPPSQPCRIVIGDDHPLFREGMANLVGALYPEADIAQADNMAEVHRQAETGDAPDLFMLDVIFPGMDIPISLPELRRRYPLASVLLVSMSQDEKMVAEAMRCGADGFVHKGVSSKRCRTAIHRVMTGEYVVELEAPDGLSDLAADNMPLTLTARQRAVLDHLAQGESNKEIGRELGISHLTVRLHVSSLLRLLGVGKRKEAVIKARALGLLEE